MVAGEVVGSAPLAAVSDPTPSSADLHTENFSKDEKYGKNEKNVNCDSKRQSTGTIG